VFVVGARPNFMKVAPIIKEIQANYAEKFCPVLIHTGQHYNTNMSKIFFEQFDIKVVPIHFHVGSGTHAIQTGEVMRKFESFLETFPGVDLVVVVGDVNSSMAAALVASKANVPVAHVEAGLRSFDKAMPEEINRIIIDSISSIFFTTEPSADDNLWFENHKKHVYRVGNVMIDNLKNNLLAARKLNLYEKYGLNKGEYILLTLHRPSNVDNKDKLASILKIIGEVSQQCKVLFLVHPRTEKKMGQLSLANIILEQSLGYLENLSLMENAKLVITDSGGIQEETTFLGTPCVTLRKNTERPITVTHGTNIIAGDNESLYKQIILDRLEQKNMKKMPIHLWDGYASQRIMKILDKMFERGDI
jgi:UDP-N-acetylglucosamine 2-epimerase (non-hydrolysing)